MNMRTVIRLLCAALLGIAAAALVSCGSSGGGLIPNANGTLLQSDFEAVAKAAASGNGSCGETESALGKTEQDFLALPATVNKGLRARLQEGIANLHKRALAMCIQSTPAATSTTSTQTTTAPSTTTTQTSTETTTPTTTTSTTTTTPTNTQTTSPTTTTTTPPGQSGGTEASGESSAEESPNKRNKGKGKDKGEGEGNANDGGSNAGGASAGGGQ